MKNSRLRASAFLNLRVVWIGLWKHCVLHNTYLSHILHMAAQADLSKSEAIAALLPENAPLECRISAPK